MRVFYAAGATPIDPALLDRGEAFAMRALDGIPFNEGKSRVDAKELCARVHNWYLEIGRTKGSSADCQNSMEIGVYDWGTHLHELGHVATYCSGCQDQGPFGLSAGPIDYHCPQWWPAAFDVGIEAARLEYQRATANPPAERARSPPD